MDPIAPDAEKEWTFWLLQFQDFVQLTVKPGIDLLNILRLYLTASNFEYVQDCKTYDEVIAKMNEIYVKLKNVIFARYEFISRKQRDGESLEDCNYCQLMGNFLWLRLHSNQESQAMAWQTSNYTAFIIPVPNCTYMHTNTYTDVIIRQDILQLHSNLTASFGGPKAPLTICGLALAKIPVPSLFVNLCTNYKPVAVKSRRYSVAEAKFINDEVRRLLAENIIEECCSLWRAQALVVTSDNHKKRMVIDYSQTINRFTLLDAYPLSKINDMVQAISKYRFFSTVDRKNAHYQIPIKARDKSYTALEAGGRLYQFKRIPFGVTNGAACFQRVLYNILRVEKLKDTFVYVDNVTICGMNREEHDENLNRFREVAEKYNLTLNNDKCEFTKTQIKLLGHIIEQGTLKPDPERFRPLQHFPLPRNTASLQRVLRLFAAYSQWIPRFLEKIHALTRCTKFLFPQPAVDAFKALTKDKVNSVVTAIDDELPFTVETDASDHAIAATFNKLVEEVELLEANPKYAHIRLTDGRVSVRHLAPARGKFVTEDGSPDETQVGTGAPREEGERAEKPDANDVTPENSENEEDTATRQEHHQTPP
ncbi:Retrovirus-related Pol polyprotein from transposon 17.6 [Trichinella nelsoni]|uniref:Retrovirus-related Pol polyprotein from transposon 17.6 n=1 Tax=Trichinella nelsoni TaxID=6336 RepID=A0A0V0S8P1_9BILA|nr:Retrovirus-related Pol polyprotein from transposon 17.6 [Trichinella nelsoni]